MIVAYTWPEDDDEQVPDIGTWLDVSGDPDSPVLRAVVARVVEDDNGTHLHLILADGQEGAVEFMTWVVEEGNFGIQVAQYQDGLV